MRIGARAHDFGVGENLLFRQIVHRIKACGYSTIQLAPAKAIAEITDVHSIEMKHIEIIREILEQGKLDVSVLGCYIEPSINDLKQRLQNVATFQQNIRYAKYLGTDVVGTETTHFPMPDEADREKAFENLKDSVKRMADTAEEEGVLIGVEAVAEHTMNTPTMTRRLIDEVGSDKVKVIFDPSNLILPEMVERQHEVFKEVYELLGEDIVAVHVKNFIVADGAKKMVPLEQGLIDFPEVFKWLKTNRPHLPLLRENSQRDSDEADIAYIKRHWQ